ncbi:MAG: M42 family metallopeptidase [Candidatus Eisenbacteria bacterium]
MGTAEFQKHVDLLKELILTPGVSGWEDPVRDKIAGKVARFGETRVDAMGNLTLTLGRGDKHALFVAHMDEIGLLVSHIEDGGFIRIRKVGGLDDRVLPGRMVDVYPEGRLEPVPGVIGLKPPHLMRDRAKEMAEVVKPEDVYIDIGTTSREETEALGIAKLSPILLRKHFSLLANDLVATRGLDDRLGCAALIEVLDLIDPAALDLKVTFAWSVQEELGLRGAYALGNTLRPDFAVAIDSCTTGDSPQVDYHLSAVSLGQGPVMRMLDRMAFASRTLMKHVGEAAGKEGIPLQVALTGGATDGAALQTFNVLMIPLSVPVRYVHSPAEVMSLRDYDNLVKLLALVVRNISAWS